MKLPTEHELESAFREVVAMDTEHAAEHADFAVESPTLRDLLERSTLMCMQEIAEARRKPGHSLDHPITCVAAALGAMVTVGIQMGLIIGEQRGRKSQ